MTKKSLIQLGKFVFVKITHKLNDKLYYHDNYICNPNSKTPSLSNEEQICLSYL